MWLQKLSKAQRTGGRCLPTHVRQAISKNGTYVQTTELFGKPYTDLIRYADLSPCSSTCPHAPTAGVAWPFPYIAAVANLSGLCVSRYKGCWMMEDWLAFTETFSNSVLCDLPWKAEEKDAKELFEKQWALLRQFVLYFLKYHEGEHTEERILQAQKDVLEYGRLAEEVCEPPFCSTMCICDVMTLPSV